MPTAKPSPNVHDERGPAWAAFQEASFGAKPVAMTAKASPVGRGERRGSRSERSGNPNAGPREERRLSGNTGGRTERRENGNVGPPRSIRPTGVASQSNQPPALVTGTNGHSQHRHERRNYRIDATRRAQADSARRVAELQASASSSLSWMALEEWRITFFFTLFTLTARATLQSLLRWSAEPALQHDGVGRRCGSIVLYECWMTVKWLTGWVLGKCPSERVFNGTTTKTRISPGFIFASSWVLLWGIWKRRLSHFDAQVEAAVSVRKERLATLGGNYSGRRLSLASGGNGNSQLGSKGFPFSEGDPASTDVKKILIPSLPVRAAECILGRCTPRSFAVTLSVQFGASFMAAVFLSRFAGPWLGLSSEFLSEALGPIVYHSSSSRPFLVDLGSEILANMLLSVSLLVLPELCILNHWNRNIVMPLVMWPLLYGTRALLSCVDQSGQGSAFAPNIIYALHCAGTASIHQFQQRAQRGGYLSILFHENLPPKQMAHILGPIIGGALGGKVMSIFFPDPEKW